jgi:hypothetical protein
VAARLRAEGFAVEAAHDGPAGVALCERLLPDLVVLDLGTINGEFGKDSQEQKPYAPPEEQDPAVVTNACFKKHHGHGR